MEGKDRIEQIFMDTFPELDILIDGLDIVGKYEKVGEYVRNCECFEVTILPGKGMMIERLK